MPPPPAGMRASGRRALTARRGSAPGRLTARALASRLLQLWPLSRWSLGSAWRERRERWEPWATGAVARRQRRRWRSRPLPALRGPRRPPRSDMARARQRPSPCRWTCRTRPRQPAAAQPLLRRLPLPSGLARQTWARPGPLRFQKRLRLGLPPAAVLQRTRMRLMALLGRLRLVGSQLQMQPLCPAHGARRSPRRPRMGPLSRPYPRRNELPRLCARGGSPPSAAGGPQPRRQQAPRASARARLQLPPPRPLARRRTSVSHLYAARWHHLETVGEGRPTRRLANTRVVVPAHWGVVQLFGVLSSDRPGLCDSVGC